jgi:hypothetical protein
VNQGVLDDHQLRRLLDNGIGYVIIHEGAFETKVTPYAPTYTLQRLLNHPRLRLLDHANGIWSFAVLEESRPPGGWKGPRVYFPMRTWQAESSGVASRETEVISHSECSGEAFTRLTGSDSSLEHRRVRTSYAPECRFLLRVRGQGELRCDVLVNRKPNHSTALKVDSNAWHWLAVPAAPYDGYGLLKLHAAWVSGAVDVDLIVLTAGRLQEAGPVARADGAAFFHHGETDVETGAALLADDRVTESLAWYGWGLPVPEGKYSVTLDVDSTSPAGTVLGHWLVRGEGLEVQRDMHITAGEPVRLELDQQHNLPIRLEIHFKWNGSLTIRGVEFARVDRDDE